MEINAHVIFALFLGGLFLVGGTFYYVSEEKWSYVDSFYFSTITLTTIGYGDMHPTTNESKIFTSLYTLFGVGVMLYLLGSVVSTFLFNQEKYLEKMIYHFRKKKENDIKQKSKK
jgi:voltage-gated potassium channel